MAAPLSGAESIQHLAYHIFLPPQLPQSELEKDADQQVRLRLVDSVISAISKYQKMDSGNALEWDRITHMLEHFLYSIELPLRKDRLSQDIIHMKPGDVLALYIRAQNAAVLIRKKPSAIVFEAFEVQAPTADVMSIPGKLVRHYPGPIIEIPNPVANDPDFIIEVSNMLAQMDAETFEQAHATTHKAGSEVYEDRDSVNPNYFVQLFFGFLRGMGEVVNPERIVKRVADEVLWKDAARPWRRTPIWLIIRVAIQTSLSSKLLYKNFMVFYHADILSQCLNYWSFPSDLLFVMRVKMARRLYKLQDSAPEGLVEVVATTTESVQHFLQKRWSRIQTDSAQPPEWDPSTFDLNSATNQTLPNSREYLEEVFKRRTNNESYSTFVPNHKPRLQDVDDLARWADGYLKQSFSDDKHISLFDFESWVYRYLSNWTKANQSKATSACKTVFSCLQQYLFLAQSYYTVDKADQSIMILTLMRLWMAIDQLAIAECPLLLNFSPEIPETLLDTLLLHTFSHIDEARVIQQHLRSRHKRTLPHNHSIFSDVASINCFGVQYFRQSTHLQSLKSAIEQDAQRKRDQKIQELEAKNEQYLRLDKQAKRLSHKYFTNRLGKKEHDRPCERCKVERARDEMEIKLHEWPLPARQLDSELVVFELERPEVFTIWRDTTYGILHDLGCMHVRGGGNSTAYTILDSYEGLRQWLSAPMGITPRVTLASTTKSFTRAHYASTKLTAKEDRVCVNNGLKFQLYDKVDATWAWGPFNNASFARFGTFELPPNSSYRHLRYALKGTTHSSNRVIADQYNCPKDLSLHEHLAFGTLRSGPRLQWMNIVRGLEENILTFGSEEVKMLHTQAAWQLGHLADDGSREWHKELECSDFKRLLVFQSRKVLKRIEANWLETTSLSIIVLLVTRLLTSSCGACDDVVEDAYNFLREARYVALRWLKELKGKLQDAENDSDSLDYQNRVCEMAAICRSTFDVDPVHMSKLLETPKDIGEFIKCSIALHDNQLPDAKYASVSLQILLCRNQRLSHKTVPHILRAVQSNSRLLCKPISEIWSGYRAGPDGWQALRAPNSRWVSTNTAARGKRTSQKVHLNLLDGRLLIDGEPLGRLPREYVQHPVYFRLFGQKTMDVVPASSAGMVFATRSPVHGHEVSFARIEDEDRIVIQAYKDDQTFELVPHSQLRDDLPEFLSTDYHHWAHLEANKIEFRPLVSPWCPSRRQWDLRFRSNRTTLEKVGSGPQPVLLVDVHSSLFHSLCQRLNPLESAQYLHVTQTRGPRPVIHIELPRMDLSFFINNDSQLESQNFRDQIVDVNQSTGTMYGLENQLVLSPRDPVGRLLPRARSVLIPHGDVQFATNGHHVSVKINSDSARNVSFYRYLIDTDLGYLVSDAGLTSRLFKIYLHALTSHCLPDPLTGLTGTEEALSQLSEPASSSFEEIDEPQANLLRLIGSLTPKREYYPSHLKCMQTTQWNNLPSLSQHFAFYTATSAILYRAQTLRVFYSVDLKIQDYMLAREEDLLKRAARRTNIYYPSDETGFANQTLDSLTLQDMAHANRDSLAATWREAGQVASWACRLTVHHWSLCVYRPFNLVALAESWENVEGASKSLDLEYSSAWLKLQLPAVWLTIYNQCRQAKTLSSKYSLAACLATAAFSQRFSPDLIATFVAFATNTAFQHLAPPKSSSFKLNDGYQPVFVRVEELVLESLQRLEDTPANKISRREDESDHELGDRKGAFYDQQINKYKAEFIQSLLDQWPSTHLQVTFPEYRVWFTIDNCLKEVQKYFGSCTRNIALREHLRKLERALSSQPASKNTTFEANSIRPPQRPTPSPVAKDPWSRLRLDSLMRTCAHPTTVPKFERKLSISARPGCAADTLRLFDLFNEFKQDNQPLNRRYGDQLDESRKDLAAKQPDSSISNMPPTETLLENAQDHHAHLDLVFRQLQSCLAPTSAIDRIMLASGIWPRITPRAVLYQLTFKARLKFGTPRGWYNELIRYAQAFTEYQRSQRLVFLANLKHNEEFYKEVDHTLDESSEEAGNPDWLLVQIDGNFSVRSVQHQVAKEMISPSSGSNTVLQLNMGEGKSSVIVPIIAASLANARQLVRVVVLKPLWRQMFHLLINRLSGLAHRRIYYLPFGRQIRIGRRMAHQLQALYAECMQEGGVLLAQPEHILSFKLMGIDQLMSSSSEEEVSTANQLRDTQRWLTETARDILDESDEILHVRYQLVYTMGQQQALEDHPDRWTTTQQLLRLAAAHLSRLHHANSASLHYEAKAHGQFPTIRIMPDCESSIEHNFISAVAKDVLAGRILNLNCSRLTSPVRKVALQFLTVREFSYADYRSLEKNCDPALWKGFLLVRGLLASGIIVFALKKKHYRVDYGLDFSRSLLAVPYRAKDIPSLRAEFGHPDVAVVLTCLSYYYKGLTDDQLDHCFKLLYKLDNPPLEYERWAKRNSNTPTDLHQLSGVNVRDYEQFRQIIVPNFSRNSAVVEFFLSSVVFPKSAKGFPHKLATSGWDLAEERHHVITGFSGTNDNQHLLPTSIKQADPVKQLSTNALVLTYLLQPENNHYLPMYVGEYKTLTTEGFLRLLVKQTPEIRVLLDVGAQMLELQNEELARCWLALRPDVEAAVYFNDKDEIVVLPQRGSPSPLHSSPFSQQLDKCVIYLDDGHTRGTDLKLPRDYRGLVTLGPKVTKDRLLQGCMRMRNLGHGQSVIFAAPPEVDRQIRAAAPKQMGPGSKVDALDVLRWAMLETCKDLRHHVSHWARQGIEHKLRLEAQQRYESTGKSISILKKGWMTPESRSLREMYGIRPPDSRSQHRSYTHRAFEDPDLRERLGILGIEKLDDASMDEEQEREVNHEIEKEQQIERPPKGKPATHALHHDVSRFAETGTIRSRSTGLVPLFDHFYSFDDQAFLGWSPKLYASTDFLQTMENTGSGASSDYMRPVNWVVEAPNEILVVLSPHEVNELLPLIRRSTSLHLHVYAPRVTQSMRSFSKLDFYSIPFRPRLPLLVVPSSIQLQLDLFAGQLYFSDYQAYALLCALLGLYTRPASQRRQSNVPVESDGFVKEEHRQKLIDYSPVYAMCNFTTSPIPTLKKLIGGRRKGMDYSRTHMGHMLHARNLTPNDF